MRSDRLSFRARPYFAEVLPALFLLAAFLTSLFYNGLDLRYYAASGVAVICALVAAMVSPALARKLSVGPAGTLLILLAVWIGAGQLWVDIPYLAAVQAGVLAAAPAAYLVFRAALTEGRGRSALARGLILIGVGITAVLLGEAVTGSRPEGPFLNVNTSAATVNLFWPLLAVLALHPGMGSRRATLLIAAVGLMAVAVGVSGGRAAALTLIGTLLVLAIGCWRWAPRWRLGTLAVSGIGGLVLADFAGRYLQQAEIRGLGHRLATLAEPTEAGAGRFPIWQATLSMIGDRPWLGWGGGSFYQTYPAYRPMADHTAGFHVHNDYLQYWVEGGIPGLVLVLSLAGVGVWAFLQLRKRDTDPDARDVGAMAAVAVIAGAGFHALFSYNLQIMPYLVIMGIAFAALDDRCHSALWHVPVRRWRTQPVPAAALFGILLLPLIHFAGVGLSQSYLQRGSALMQLGFYEPADQALERAGVLWPRQDLVEGLRGQVRRRALKALDGNGQPERRDTLKSEGLARVERAVELNPWRTRHHRIKAGLLAEQPDADLAAAEDSLRHALHLNPRAAAARRDLGLLLRRQGRFDQALKIVNAGFGMFYAQNDPIPLMRLGVELREKAGDESGAARLREQIQERAQRAASLKQGTDELLME